MTKKTVCSLKISSSDVKANSSSVQSFELIFFDSFIFTHLGTVAPSVHENSFQGARGINIYKRDEVTIFRTKEIVTL